MSELNFKEGFTRLKAINEQVRTQGIEDIDQLIPQLEESTRCYRACAARINQIKQAMVELVPTELREDNQKGE